MAFKPLKPLSTKIINALAATDAEEQTIDDAKTTNARIQGKRTKPVAKPDAKALAAGAEPVKNGFYLATELRQNDRPFCAVN